MAEAGPALLVAAAVPYSNNLINNRDNNPSYLIDISRVIAAERDTSCESYAVPSLAEDLQAQAVDARDDNYHDLAVLSDDVPSSQGTPIRIHYSAFNLISYINTQFITPCNIDNGPFRIIQRMIHSLFYSNNNCGFVGFTQVGVLSEYTATIYYAATESFTHYHNIIKIMIHCMSLYFGNTTMNNVLYAFKLDRGVKPGDTIKLILSLTFGEGNGANVILIPILNIVGFNLSSTIGAPPQAVTSIENFFTPALPPILLQPRDSFSIFDLIARIRLYANQEAFGALIEPTDAEKILMQSFFANITPDGLVAFIQFIKFAFYTDARVPQDKNFAFFLNIFFNFYKVSMNATNPMASLSTAKIMYTDFFSNDNNYGSIIRIFNNMMSFPLFNQHAIMFLSGSNAARAYKLIQEMLNMDTRGMNLEQIQIRRGQIYDTHMATLSDNDFMFYLLNEGSEPYRLAIRMMLGACLYYLKYILNPTERGRYTNLLEESISIVGHDDHLLAQRLNANEAFLERCFNTIMSYTDVTNTLQNVTIGNILGLCNIAGFNFYQQLSGNVTLAFLDVVFKHNTAESWYISVFSIFDVPINVTHGEVLNFLTTQAMAVNCIATPWTLILNILYTIFVTENCVARIVVGKLGNDPKNLEKYFSILNTHLNYLLEQYSTAIQDEEEEFRHRKREERHRVRDTGTDTGRGRGRDTVRGRDRDRDTDRDIQENTDEQRDIDREQADNAKIRLFRTMLANIIKIKTFQDQIIDQSHVCQQSPTVENPIPISDRYETLKGLCRAWVQEMFILALEPATRELFFLSDAYRFTTREATLLEKGICCAWTLNGNICNKDEFLAQFNTTSVAAITVDNFQPVYTAGNPSEQRMHQIVPQLQQIVSGAIGISQTFNVTPNPPLVGQEREVNHYAYMNYLWKHLTETSINLRSSFKSIVKDLKRIVGSKYFTAISLLGAYPCGLLIDELKESNNTYINADSLTALKNSDGIINCRRGLLPLLVPHPNSTLFARMVVELLHIDYTSSGNNPEIYSTNNILIFLGFLFSIKIKSNASIGPRNMLSLVDSIINFSNIPEHDSLLPYTGNPTVPVPGTCSLARLSSTPHTETCATGGLGLNGGAPSSAAAKKVAAALTKTPTVAPVKASAAAKASAAPIKASEAIARGVSKSETVSKPDAKKLKNALDTTEKVKTNADKQILKAQEAVKHKEEKEKAVAAYVEAAPIARARAQLLNPSNGPFKNFMDKIKEVFTTGITATDGTVKIVANSIPFNPKNCITGITRQDVFNIDTFYNRDPTYRPLRLYVGGSNKKTKANNKSSKTNNHTRRNKNKRKKNSKTKTKFKTKSSPKHRKSIPYSRSGSQSNRKKSKPKKSQKNVTFKRRRTLK